MNDLIPIPEGLTPSNNGKLEKINDKVDLLIEYKNSDEENILKEFSKEFNNANSQQSKKEEKNQSKFLNGLKEKMNNGMKTVSSSALDLALGPLNSFIDPLNSIFKTDIKAGILSLPSVLSEKFKKNNEEKDKKQNSVLKSIGQDKKEVQRPMSNPMMPKLIEDKTERIKPDRSTLLLKGGIQGAASVYLADTLSQKASKKERSKEKKEKRNLPPWAKNLMAYAPALAGIAAFVALNKDDFISARKKWKEGDKKGAVGDALIGNVDNEKKTGSKMVKRGLGVGAAALGVGTTVGALGAGGGLAAIGTAAVAAFPPALIAAGVAAAAVGVRAAYVHEWDKKSKEATDKFKETMKDENATFFEKVKQGGILLGKATFGMLAGRIRGAVDRTKEKISDIKNIAQDDSKNILQKIGGIGKEVITAPLQILSSARKGFMDTAKSYAFNILPEGLQEKIMNTKARIKKEKKEFIEKLKSIKNGIVGKVKDGITASLNFMKDKAFPAIGNFLKKNANFVKEKIRDLKEKFLSSLSALLSSVGDFFKNIFTLDMVKNIWQKGKSGIANIGSALFNSPDIPSTEDSPIKVNDAIISKSGKVIQASEDDNIIATKNPIQHLTSNNNQISMDNGKVVEALMEILSVLKAQGKTTVVENQNFKDLDSLRMVSNG